METSVVSQGQFLTFALGGERFAVEVAKVREVLGSTGMTDIPRTPAHMMGVINLRGRAVPVMDMRRKLGMCPAERTVDTCIIILEVASGAGEIVMGALVDSVREVSGINEADIEAAPRMGPGGRDAWIRGMGRDGDRFVIIVDVDEVFADEVQWADGSAGEESGRAA
ncbi:Chemotaxis protein CheW [Pseudodesulfovibrio hydrargyri]|uniref:Chemotaxis protein CheW n=1 Tax=Pseudodesulfovibrio hydrargyri TaxID=2125990 RepID=A0A1J5N5G9_9BACT|nr:chemotaxis protein CheW [Pseudodesulfovibrio hydrargyri]OIQ50867.1 Chemotaxis protein CheW [Pseudodesulfovibrio hydrargyri]